MDDVAGGSKGGFNPNGLTNSKNKKVQHLPGIVEKRKSKTRNKSEKQQQPSVRPLNVKRKSLDLIKKVKIKQLAPHGRSSTTLPISMVMQKVQVGNSLQNVKAAPMPPEVWEQIATYLDLLSLKSLRLCSKMLNAVANRIIYYRTHEGYTISFKYDKEKDKCFFLKKLGLATGPSWMKRQESIDDLVEFLENSSTFPSYGVRLCGGSIYSSDIKKFFQRQGHVIKTMKVELCRRRGKSHVYPDSVVMDTPSILLDLLCLLPNLEFLDMSLSEDVLEHKYVPLTVSIPPFNLPALKRFNLLQFELLGAEVTKAILTAAPNLANFHCCIRSMRLDYINLLTTTKTFHAVKHLHFQPDTHTYNLFDRVTSTNLQLDSITFNLWNMAICYHIWPGISIMISRLLESSKDTLTKMWLETPVGFLDQVNWPVLRNLSEIRIVLDKSLFNDPSRQRFTHCYFPERLDWALVFPRIRKLTVNFKSAPFHHPSTGLIFGNATSLKALDIPCIIPFHYNCVPQSTFEQLPKFFPNLSHLGVHVARDDFAKVLRIIWTKFNMLKSVRVEFIETTGLWIRSHLNAVLTGFSESTCIQLKGGQPFVELEKLRVYPSILNLKDLTELEIVFSTDKSWTDPGNHDHLLNDVAFWHAFQLMPKLRVKILVHSRDAEKVNKSLKSIASHVAVQVVPP